MAPGVRKQGGNAKSQGNCNRVNVRIAVILTLALTWGSVFLGWHAKYGDLPESKDHGGIDETFEYRIYVNGSARSWGLGKEDGEKAVPSAPVNSSNVTVQESAIHTSGLPYIHDDSIKVDEGDRNVENKTGKDGKGSFQNEQKPKGEGGRAARRGDAGNVQGKIVLSPQPSTGCKIHVWDLGRDVAPELGMSVCNITDVWPFDHPGSGIAGMRRTAHMDAPHAAGYWLSNAVKASPYYESNIEKADLVLLDTHCYESWYFVLEHLMEEGIEEDSGPVNDLSLMISRVFVEGVMTSKQFVRSKGKKFVIVRPTLGAPPGAMLDTCAKLKMSFIVSSERGVFCDNDRDKAFHGQSIILPLVSRDDGRSVPHVSNREIFFYLRFPCYKEINKDLNAAKIFINALLKHAPELKTSDILIDLPEQACASDKRLKGRALVRDNMARSRYCGIIPSLSSQATVELSLAVQSGCIPVFLGPPFHAMPLSLDIDYSKIAIFVHIVEHVRSIWDSQQNPMAAGDLEPDEIIKLLTVQVPDFPAAIKHLRHMSASLTEMLQKQLSSERNKFRFDSTDSTSTTTIALKRMCEYSNRMKTENEQKARDRAAAEMTNAVSLESRQTPQKQGNKPRKSKSDSRS
eukprot:jgi/Picsp_1/833/NSC_04321-R1_hypothetical protein COCSUDRAFT_64203 [Coccomyxa subellipsoidea C-169]